MNARKHNSVNVLATGTVVVMLVSISVFWARWLCTVKRADLLPPSAHKVTVPIPPGALGVPTGDDPNLTADLSIEAQMPRYGFDPVGLGVLHYVDRQLDGELFWRGNRYDREMDALKLYYDGRLGQIVYKMPKDREEEARPLTSREMEILTKIDDLRKKVEKYGLTAQEVVNKFNLY